MSKSFFSENVTGGLVMRSLGLLNKALLGKWLQRFTFKCDSFQKKGDNREIQGTRRGLVLQGKGRSAYDSNLWKAIRKSEAYFFARMCFSIGNSLWVKFCHDSQLGGVLLKGCFPELFNLWSRSNMIRVERIQQVRENNLHK